MKNGIASSGKESSPVTDFCASITMGISEVSHIAMPVESPRVMPIGILSPIVTISREKRITASIYIISSNSSCPFSEPTGSPL